MTTAERFHALYTGAVTDVLDRRGLLRQTLPAELAPLEPGTRLAGPAFTVEGRPHPEHDYDASIRKILADEHGQAIMGLAKDLAGASGMLNGTGPSEVPGGMWHYGFLFAPALTVGGGTGEVQRNIVAERVLGLPHDVDVEAGQSWAAANTRN